MSFVEISEINRITEKIIGGAYTVSNALGAGFLEKVYENALAHELRKAGFSVETQKPIQVWYDGVLVGDYYADLLSVFICVCLWWFFYSKMPFQSISWEVLYSP